VFLLASPRYRIWSRPAGSAAALCALTLSFKTIHASKGLEQNHVVLLNAGNSGRVGFSISDQSTIPLLGIGIAPTKEHSQNAEGTARVDVCVR